MKKFLTCLCLLFSFFLVGNVKAYFTYNGVTYDENKITELARTAFNDNSFNPSDYYVQCSYYRTANPSYCFYCFFMEHPYTSMTTSSTGTYSNSYKVYGQQGNSATNGAINYRYSFNYNLQTGGWYSVKTTAGTANGFSSSYGGNIFTNFEYTRDGTVIAPKLNFSTDFHVYFHLNGGSVWDFSNLSNPHLITEDYNILTNNYDFHEYLNEITPFKDYSNFLGWYYDAEFTQPYNSSDTYNSDVNLYAKFELYDYLQGYKKIDLTTADRYYMLSGVSSGSVFIPKGAFDDYGGRLSYYDNDLSSQPYTSYIQEYVTTPDNKFVRQDFNLSDYEGSDWVMFSKYIYLEGQDNISYSIFVPDTSYDSPVLITPNSSGGNTFEFEYIDSNGDIQSEEVHTSDLSQQSPLLSNMFTDFTNNDFGLSSILTAPLPLIQSLGTATCTPLNLPISGFTGIHDQTLTLPCMTPLYQTWFGDLFTLYQTITTGFIAYWIGIAFFNQIKQLKDPNYDKIEVINL